MPVDFVVTQTVYSLTESVHNFVKVFETRETKKVELRCKLIFKEKNSRHFFVENHLNVIFLCSQIITIRQVLLLWNRFSMAYQA